MIIPGILEKTFEKVKKEVAAVDSVAKLVQIDICDGKFVHEKTFLAVERLDEIETPAEFELHLMVEAPLKFLSKKLKKVTRVILHVETSGAASFVEMAKTLGYKVGVAINPQTKLEALAPFMGKVDFVQFMTVVPGAQGRDFSSEVLDKITIFRQTAPKVPVQVDGGIDEETLAMVIEAGAKDVVIGSQIFQSPAESLKTFEERAKESREFGREDKHKIKKIAFLGGAGWEESDEVYKSAYETAKLLAKAGYEIVNGGGPGIMRAATHGAHNGGGKVLAITYYPTYKHKNYEGVDKLNKFDEEIVTMDYFDRTKVMLQNSDVHVVFKGATGTISEFGMTWANSRIHEGHSKPIILFGDFWKHIIEEFNTHMAMRPNEPGLLKIVETPEEVLGYIKSLS